ncbi:MAG TPA: T9SS type A sorting domain-containing protein, partial [Saprospiraceae bacterium]|nr:T9SS type A sorting domain-containing protein [Saprospiraceae bacterium]
IQEIIKRTADPKTFSQDCSGLSGLDVPNPIYGYGRINSLRAVQEALKYQTSRTDKVSASNFQLFPNPAASSIMLKRNNSHSGMIEIFDLHGKKVISIQSQLEFTHIDLTSLNAGVYFVKLNQGNKIEIGKFIKV